MGGGTGPVCDGRHDPAGEHQRNRGVPGEHGEHRPDCQTKYDDAGVEGVHGVCHVLKVISP